MVYIVCIFYNSLNLFELPFYTHRSHKKLLLIETFYPEVARFDTSDCLPIFINPK